jgi:hypothetical protein
MTDFEIGTAVLRNRAEHGVVMVTRQNAVVVHWHESGRRSTIRRTGQLSIVQSRSLSVGQEVQGTGVEDGYGASLPSTVRGVIVGTDPNDSQYRTLVLELPDGSRINVKPNLVAAPLTSNERHRRTTFQAGPFLVPLYSLYAKARRHAWAVIEESQEGS